MIPLGFWGGYGVLVLASLAMGMIITEGLRRFALRIGFVDRPGGRKHHAEPVPPIGGVAIFLTFFLMQLIGPICVSIMGAAAPLSSSWASHEGLPWNVNLAVGMILLLGILDDKWEVDARLKFLIHFIVAGILVMGAGVRIDTLGNLFGTGDLDLGWFAVPFSIMCIVYIINAVNMMDGLDGLAGGNSVIILGWFTLATVTGADGALITSILPQLLPLLGALLAFLMFNARAPWRKRASVFLGDAGTMAIGVMIAWFAISLSQGAHAVLQPISVAWIIALPIIDAFGVFLTRLLRGKKLFTPDHSHFHHHFIKAKWGVGACVCVILSWSLLLGAVGFLGTKWGWPTSLLGYGWVALWLSHALLAYKGEKFSRILSIQRK